MKPEDYISIITSVATLLTAMIGTTGAILALRQGQRNEVALRNTNIAIDEQHKATNSRLTELIDSSKQAADAIGHARGVAEERARDANPI
jgi:hypothetical protein